MTEKTGSEYLKAAAEHIKEIYKKLGHSPTAAEYDNIAESKFKLRALKKNNIKGMNQLKEAACIPKRKPGTKKGYQKHDRKPDIFCRAYGKKMAAADCMPGYKKEFCNKCKSKQRDNAKPIPDLPKELETSNKYNDTFGSGFMNGNSIYLTDVGPI